VTEGVGKAVFAASLIAYAVLTALCFFFVDEDAYIYFRVAENLANGHGYVFNRGGPPIETGSAPLWQALMAVGAALKLHPVHFSKILGLGLGLVTLMALHAAGRRLAAPVISACAALMLATSATFVWWTGSGLEVAGHTALLMLCVALALTPGEPQWRRALPFALLPFMRPEGLLYAGVFAAYFAWTSQRRLAIRVALVTGVSYLAYLVFRLVYFHDLQISAFYAKIVTGEFAWSYLFFVLSTLGLWACLPAVLAAPWLARKGETRAGLALLWGLSMAGLYFATSNRDFKVYYRFFALCVPALLLLCAVSFEVVRARMPERWRRAWLAYGVMACAIVIWRPELPPHWDRHDERLSATSPLVVTLQEFSAAPLAALQAYAVKLGRPDVPSEYGARLQQRIPYVVHENYQAAVGAFLRDNYPKQLVIAYDQMGQTPYFAGHGHTFLDFLGLATHEVSLAMFNERAATSITKRAYKACVDPIVGLVDAQQDRDVDFAGALRWVREQNPDLVLIHAKLAHSPIFLTHHVAHSAWLAERYVPRYRLATWVTVFERKDRAFPQRVRETPAILELRALR
jgi:hypothetical protein